RRQLHFHDGDAAGLPKPGHIVLDGKALRAPLLALEEGYQVHTLGHGVASRPASQDAQHALASDTLAGLYNIQRHLGEAEPLYRRALAIRDKTQGRVPPIPTRRGCWASWASSTASWGVPAKRRRWRGAVARRRCSRAVRPKTP